MTAGSQGHSNISKASAFYRCKSCRARYCVTTGSSIFRFVGGGMLSPSLQVKAMWNCVQGADATFTALDLNVSEDTVSTWYAVGREIMAWDALRRQSAIVFGARGSKTTDAEADETVVAKFKIREEGKPVIYCYYVYLGVEERSNSSTLWMKSLGLHVSEEHGRVSPIEKAEWHSSAVEVFNETSNVILNTDGAVAYRDSEKLPGIVEHYSVNHSRKPTPELSRSESFLVDVDTGERRAGMAGTQYIDKTWDFIKDGLPRSLSARTAQGRQRIDEYVRMQQWRRMLGTEDRWKHFCDAAAQYDKERSAKRAQVVSKLHPGQLVRNQQAGPRLSAKAVVDADPDRAADEVVSRLRPGQLLCNQKAEPELSVGELAHRDRDLSLWGDRYFERQEDLKSGRHAVNNLMGGPQFIDSDLDMAVDIVVGEVGDVRGQHAGPLGWYSHST